MTKKQRPRRRTSAVTIPMPTPSDREILAEIQERLRASDPFRGR